MGFHAHGFGHGGCHPHGWHHNRPFAPTVIQLGPGPRMPFRPMPHVHRPWFQSCWPWSRPVCVTEVRTTPILHTRTITPVSSILAAATLRAIGVTAMVAGGAMVVLGASLLPVSFGASMGLMTTGSAVALGGFVTACVA